MFWFILASQGLLKLDWAYEHLVRHVRRGVLQTRLEKTQSSSYYAASNTDKSTNRIKWVALDWMDHKDQVFCEHLTCPSLWACPGKVRPPMTKLSIWSESWEGQLHILESLVSWIQVYLPGWVIKDGFSFQGFNPKPTPDLSIFVSMPKEGQATYGQAEDMVWKLRSRGAH